MMRQRLLGRTGVSVSEIGFGCWGIGGFLSGASYGETDDRTSIAALNRAYELGIRFFDTADSYGQGRSERLLGEVFGRGKDAFIATKAGRPRLGGDPDFSPANLRSSVDGSLRRLKRERIDLLQLHDPPMELLRSQPEILGTIQDLRRAGKIRCFGISTKTPAEAVQAIQAFAAEVVQANFNLADQRAIDDGLFDAAAKADCGLIVRTPFAFGLLCGTVGPATEFAAGDHRANWPKERLEQWAAAAPLLVGRIAERDRQSLALVALRFCLSFPAVTTVIPGMLTPKEAEENARASAAGPLAAADLASIRGAYGASAFAGARIATPRPRKRLMLTGVTGVLGSAFLDLAPEWPEWEIFASSRNELDLTDESATRDYVRRNQISHIVHLAAISGGVALTRRFPARILRDNVAMTFSILEAAVACGVRKVVLTLSSGAYPAKAPQPNVETQLHDGPPHESAQSYAYAKRLIDPAIRAYRAEHKLSVIGLIPSGIFGENDNYNVDDCTWIAGLIRRFCEWTPDQPNLVIWGDGSPVREITDARDMARAYMWCLDNYDAAEPLNVGCGQECTIRSVALKLADIVGMPHSAVSFDPTHAQGIDRRVSSNGKFLALSSFRYTPIEASLARVVAWYRETLRRDPAAIRRSPRIVERR